MTAPSEDDARSASEGGPGLEPLLGTLVGTLVIWAVSYEVGIGELVGALVGALRVTLRRPAPPAPRDLDVLRMLNLHTRSACSNPSPTALDCAHLAGIDAMGHATAAARILVLRSYPAHRVPRALIADALRCLAEAATWLDVASAHRAGEDGADVATRAGAQHRDEVLFVWNELTRGTYGTEAAADLAAWGASDLLRTPAAGPLEATFLRELNRVEEGGATCSR